MNQIGVYAHLRDGPVLIGQLYPHRDGGRRRSSSSTFVYDVEWVARTDAFDLDPATPRGSGGIQSPESHVLPRALSDCSPDRWGRLLRKREERSLAEQEGRRARQLDEFDLLLGVRDDLRQGDLRLHSDGEFQRPGGPIPVLAELGELLELSERAVADDDLGTEELARLVRQGSSLGGARPKAHVRDNDGRLGIAKFPASSIDTWNVMAWEKVCLDLASAAGIDVPGRQLLDIGGRQVLIVSRFDRAHRPGETPRRIGYRSALTMCERSDGDAGSYLEIAGVIQEASPSATEDLQQLWRRIAFNMLVTNTDDHLRNHAFLQTGGNQWRLAPAFDLNPDPDAGDQPHLHTAIDDYSTEADVELLLEIAPLMRVGSEARSILRELADVVGRWKDAAHRVGLDAAEQKRMSPAFDHDRLVAARQV